MRHREPQPQPQPQPQPECRDRGSYAVEFAAGWAIFLLAVAIIAVAFQTEQARSGVRDAAREAARAASLAATSDDARQQADAVARRALAGGSCAAGSENVAVDVSEFGAGGIIAVTVRCRIRVVLGPSRTAEASSDEVIDRYRGGLPDRS
jgi:Flp pilus assembly protein TadG